jgi:hypothetical protein
MKLAELEYKITDKALIIHVLNSLNENYAMEIKMIEHKMELAKESSKEVTIQDLRSELNLPYERLKELNKPTTVMNHAYYMGTKFRGKCNWCGKIGHKESECRYRIAGKPKSTNYTNHQQKDNEKGE